MTEICLTGSPACPTRSRVEQQATLPSEFGEKNRHGAEVSARRAQAPEKRTVAVRLVAGKPRAASPTSRWIALELRSTRLQAAMTPSVDAATCRVIDEGEREFQHDRKVPRRDRSMLWIAGTGALAYNSWPLGFVVNRPLAGSALASSFEGHRQPFSWLFIALDCIAGFCISLTCIHAVRRSVFLPARSMGAFTLALIAYGIFGVATAVDAVVPLACGSKSAQACASQLWPPTPDDILTGLAIFALFFAVLVIVAQMARRLEAFPQLVPVTVMSALAAWTGLGLIVLLGGTSTSLAASSQYAFLTLTSVMLFIVPVAAARLQRCPAGIVQGGGDRVGAVAAGGDGCAGRG